MHQIDGKALNPVFEIKMGQTYAAYICHPLAYAGYTVPCPHSGVKFLQIRRKIQQKKPVPEQFLPTRQISAYRYATVANHAQKCNLIESSFFYQH